MALAEVPSGPSRPPLGDRTAARWGRKRNAVGSGVGSEPARRGEQVAEERRERHRAGAAAGLRRTFDERPPTSELF